MTAAPIPGADRPDRLAPVVDLRTGRPVEQALAEGDPRPATGVADRWDRLRATADTPVLPAWVRDRRMVGQRARWVAIAALRSAARSPLVAVRLIPPAGRGTRRAIRAWWRWVRAERVAAEVADLRTDAPQMWRDGLVRVSRIRRHRAWVTVATIPTSALTVAGAGMAYGPWVWLATGTAVTAAAVVAGRRPGEPIVTAAAAPERPIVLGMPAAQLTQTITDALRRLRVDAQVLRVRAHPWGWDVDLMGTATAASLTARLADLETRLRTRPGALSLIADGEDAGRSVLRIVWSDPYRDMPAPPRVAPRSRSAVGAVPIGRTLDGGQLLIPAVAHTAIVGKSGSGKSSALWTLLDVLTACRDAVVWGADLSDGPALNTWGDLISAYASDPVRAQGVLRAALAIAHARAAVLGQRLRPSADSDPGERVSENWLITPADPALILVLDEYPLMVAASVPDGERLSELVEEILRVGRKSAVTCIIASQRAGRTEMGTTTVKSQVSTRILLACEAGDVEMLMGPGMRSRGWMADRLTPATPAGPGDAGRCYVSGPGHTEPRISAVYRLDAAEVRRRAVERLRHNHAPRIDRATWDRADAYARRRWGLGMAELLTGSDPGPVGTEGEHHQGDDESGRMLRAVADVMQAAGTDRMHTADLIPALADRWPGLTPERLADAARSRGVSPRQVKIAERNRNGYALADITAALTDSTPGPTR